MAYRHIPISNYITATPIADTRVVDEHCKLDMTAFAEMDDYAQAQL